MKYSAVLLFAAGALAQDITSVGSSSAPMATGLTSAVQCALACDAGDVNCQAKCLGNARPNASQAIATNECAAKCDQGDGSPAATEAFSKCVDACINSLFPSSQTAFPDGGAGAGAPAASSATAATSGAADNSARPTGTSGSGSGSGAPSGTTAGSTGSPSSTAAAGAADKTAVQYFGAGLAGLLAVFAL